METTVSYATPNPLSYMYRATHKLPDLWNDPKVNRNGLRALFRRWRPGLDGQPTMEMRSAIWSYLGSPDRKGEEESGQEQQVWGEFDIDRAIDRAAVMTVLRASAGEHEQGDKLRFGSALFRAKLSDLRFMRLMTTPQSGRLEALRRALQLLDHAGLGLEWDYKEVRHFYGFLFGSEEQAQRSANQWAGDFFAARGKKDDDKTADQSTTSHSTQE